MRKNVCLFLVLLLVLAGCSQTQEGPRYEAGSNGPDSVLVTGLDADALEYNGAGVVPAYLYFASPRFLGESFGEAAEGEAALEDGIITVSYTRNDDRQGTVMGAVAWFQVDVDKGQVMDHKFTPYEGKEISLTEEEMVSAGQSLAEIIRGAEEFLEGN